MAQHIELQSSCGDFSPEFMKELPAVEKTMVAHGLDPARFVISKDWARVPYLPIAFRPDGQPIEYTVFVKGRSFTVTQPDDTSFLAYFCRLCLATDEREDPHSFGHALHAEERNLEAVMRRLEKWLGKPVL
jgi:hypothetical protein